MKQELCILATLASLVTFPGSLYAQMRPTQPSQPKKEQPECQKEITQSVVAAWNEIIPRANVYRSRKDQFKYTNYLSPAAMKDPNCFLRELNDALKEHGYSAEFLPNRTDMFRIK